MSIIEKTCILIVIGLLIVMGIYFSSYVSFPKEQPRIELKREFNPPHKIVNLESKISKLLSNHSDLIKTYSNLQSKHIHLQNEYIDLADKYNILLKKKNNP